MSLKDKEESIKDLKSIIMMFISDVKADLFITTKSKSLYRVNSYEWQNEGLLCQVGDVDDNKSVLIEYQDIKRIEDKIDNKVFYEITE